jgi:hypothetical protein
MKCNRVPKQMNKQIWRCANLGLVTCGASHMRLGDCRPPGAYKRNPIFAKRDNHANNIE